MKIIQNTKKYIKTHDLIERGDHILVGVSGGADSMALLHILNELRYEFGFQLSIAHFNHNLRQGNTKEQKFVNTQAEELNISIYNGEWKRSSKTKKTVSEEDARKHRLQFFTKTARTIKANKIALAHTHNDLAETVLMRILRGSGLHGLQGILPKRELHNFLFIRPLLTVQRKDIEQYLKNKKVKFCTDPTNKTTQFTRNKIRLKLLPLLEKDYNNNIAEILANLSNIISTDYDYIAQQSQSAYKKLVQHGRGGRKVYFNRKSFNRCHLAIQHMLIRQAVEAIHGNTNKLTFSHMVEVKELMENKPDQSIVNLVHNIKIRKDSKYIYIYK